MPKYRKECLAMEQTPVPCGNHVVKMDAHTALTKLKPKIIIAAWITHKYNASEHWREGNETGVDESEIVIKANYIHIGNVNVHKNKPVQEFPHITIRKH